MLVPGEQAMGARYRVTVERYENGRWELVSAEALTELPAGLAVADDPDSVESLEAAAAAALAKARKSFKTRKNRS